MKKLLLLLVLICPLFTGCVAGVFLVGATTGGAVVFDKRSAKVIVQDREISQLAHNRLNQDDALHGKMHIQIATFNHVVLMVGQALTPDVRVKAYQIVASVKGVRRIYNQVVIGKPIGFGQRSDDTWITTKVKSAMILQKGLRSGQIKVVTENHVVYLMGMVTIKQAELAADVARRINGVSKVVKVFEYVSK